MVVRNKPIKPIDFDHATDAQLRAKKNQVLTRLNKRGASSSVIRVGLEYIAMLDRELERRKNG